MLTKETFMINGVVTQMDLIEFDVCMHCDEPIRADEYYITVENDTRYCSDECFIAECQRDGIVTYRNK